MTVYLCHEQPGLLAFETAVVVARPGAIVLARSALHPGGGGQVSDQAQVEHAGGVARITGVSVEDGRWWHLLDAPLELAGTVAVRIDAALRALEPEINAVIRRGLPVVAEYVAADAARTTPGLVRSHSVAPPPTPDGCLRVIDIQGLDRQACGGTHLDNTARSAPIRIVKIENKGRHNRRVRIELAGDAPAA